MDGAVLEAMLPFLKDQYGNPSSPHKHGLSASIAVEGARQEIAQVLDALPHEIFFTSGATESNNTVIKGVYMHSVERGIPRPHFIVSSIEHKCILNAAHYVEALGAKVTFLDVDKEGHVSIDALRAAFTPETVLVSIMWANNEIGTINPIKLIAQECKSRGVLLHTDAAQGIGKDTIDLHDVNVDFMSTSAHKFYGPKGVGLLYIKADAQQDMTPLIHGGGQENGLRSGTHNVAGIIGMAKALELFCGDSYIKSENERQLALAKNLVEGINSFAPGVILNGPQLGEGRLAGNINISFKDINEKLFNKRLKGLMISSGSACSSSDLEPSYVLMALGLSSRRAMTSYRIGLSKNTTSEEIQSALTMIQTAYQNSKLA